MPEPVAILEAMLFASEGPLEIERVRDVLDLTSDDEAQELVATLRERLERDGRALQVVEVGGGVRLVTRPEVAPWLVRLARSRTRSRLSRPALEALAIIAYRQPVSRPEIDGVRGVNSEGVLDSLLERRLVRISGRKDGPGRPFLYETTREFLVAFGLRDRGDLPKLEGEPMLADLAEPADEAAAREAAAAVGDTTRADEEGAIPAIDPDQQDSGPGWPGVAPER